MPALTLTNLFLYAAQAAVVIGALAALLAVLRLSPAFRLAACRAVLVALLVLPWLAVLRTTPSGLPPGPLSAAPGTFVGAIDARVSAGTPWAAIASGMLAAGVVLRLLWLLVGLIRLSRLTRRLPAAEATDEVDALQAELGTCARVHFAPGIAQPMTFGVAPAIVLLPTTLRDASSEVRTAVLRHELLHVRRKDWPWVLAEEAVLALMWFHPAVWWLVGELQLAREQVVDRLTVAATGARRAYMDALLSAADAPSAPPLLAGFLRRRHLARRLIALTEEVVMSRARLAVGGVLVVGVLLGSGAVAVAAWPLTAAQVSAAPGEVATSPGQLVVAHRVGIDMPGGLSPELTSATILLDLVVDAQGEVTAVRPVSFAMRNDATNMSLSITDLRAAQTIVGRITAAGAGGSPGRVAPDGAAIARDLELMLKAASAAFTQWRLAPPAAAPAIARVSAQFDLAAGQATAGAAQPLSGFSGVPGEFSTFVARRDAPADDRTLRVGGAIAPPRKIVNVAAIYPQEAKDAKVQGVVVIETLIDESGAVKEAWVLKSVPLLDGAALEAVKQWRFEPTLVNGVPTAVRCTITVNFTLAP
ncbi:MAG TPA: M56 family metallopeptidase [Vicinamibacterales bacterium]|jgi:TonB family protein|nr:M56 family metallopeptidase [Vicinamibacterales bacterium]